MPYCYRAMRYLRYLKDRLRSCPSADSVFSHPYLSRIVILCLVFLNYFFFGSNFRSLQSNTISSSCVPQYRENFASSYQQRNNNGHQHYQIGYHKGILKPLAYTKVLSIGYQYYYGLLLRCSKVIFGSILRTALPADHAQSIAA